MSAGVVRQKATAAGIQLWHLPDPDLSPVDRPAFYIFYKKRLTPLLSGPAWSETCLPFFCRIEHRWAKTNRIPLKFRLGSVDYVDWLEGKGSAF